ncbi:MAG: NifU family protein, partial [Mycobacteriaceae bacterium]|nr:NifU family protein [Mycobacteriaceae bacterium]
MIPLHAVAGANPQQLRWVVASDPLPPIGTVRRAPGHLGALLHDGVIEELLVRATDMALTLSAGNSWRQYGDQIRDALTDALQDPASWQVEAEANDTTRLTEITTELLAGPIGDLATSHGGSIKLVSV